MHHTNGRTSAGGGEGEEKEGQETIENGKEGGRVGGWGGIVVQGGVGWHRVLQGGTRW